MTNRPNLSEAFCPELNVAEQRLLMDAHSSR